MSTEPTVPLDIRLMDGLAYLLFGLATLLYGALLLMSLRSLPVWNWGGISLSGQVEHQSAAAVRTQVLSRLQGHFLTVDLQEVRARFESLPWVRHAVVQRRFPNRLEVRLEEHQAVAWWNERGSGRLVDVNGQVFEAMPDDETQTQSWSELAGPDHASTRVYAFYQQLQAPLRTLQRSIARLELDERDNWQLRLDSGTWIVLGRGEPEQLLARLSRYVATAGVLQHRYAGRELQTVDLRYPSGYAVRMEGVSTVPSATAISAPKPR